MSAFPLILSAPSGAGKTTLAKLLLHRRVDVGYSISCTTRLPRPGEVDGRDYHFLTPDAFAAAEGRGEFAESADVHGNRYGTLKREVERVLAAGRHVVMDIDVQGARQFVASYPGSVLLFLLPPSADVLVARLAGRNTESPDVVARRLRSARAELAAIGGYQYVIVNDDLERAYAQVCAVVEAETVRRDRQADADARVALLLDGLDRAIRQYALTP